MSQLYVPFYTQRRNDGLGKINGHIKIDFSQKFVAFRDQCFSADKTYNYRMQFVKRSVPSLGLNYYTMCINLSTYMQ